MAVSVLSKSYMDALRIETDNNPEEITWILVNVKGDTVLSGKKVHIMCMFYM